MFILYLFVVIINMISISGINTWYTNRLCKHIDEILNN